MTGTSFIKPIHLTDFQTVTSRFNGKNIRLASCRVNGEPSVAIVRAAYQSLTEFGFEALFVWPTESMVIDMIGRFSKRRRSGGSKRS
jgi:hypothetical protein